MKALTKSQREAVRKKYGGKCAYCGCVLDGKWHVDHLEPICRTYNYVNGRAVPDGDCYYPHLHHESNWMPACPPCNVDKHRASLETWRQKLQRSCDVLRAHTSTYRHAKRFGLVTETEARIVFHFEKVTNDHPTT